MVESRVALAQRWFPHRIGSSSSHTRLVCLPYAGGTAALYRSWATELTCDVDVCAAELPGRATRFSEPPPRALDEIVEPLRDLLLDADEPVALFGHSLGALVAFELARALRDGNAPPSVLIVAGARGPRLVRREQTLHDLPHDAFVAKLGEMGGTPREVLENADLVELLVPMLRADFGLAERYDYRPAAPLPCPIVALGGVLDEAVSTDDLDAWALETEAGFTRHVLPGGHFFVVEERSAVQSVVARTVSCG